MTLATRGSNEEDAIFDSTMQLMTSTNTGDNSLLLSTVQKSKSEARKTLYMGAAIFPDDVIRSQFAE